MSQSIQVAVLMIPGTAQSAVYGLIDLCQTANRILAQMQIRHALKLAHKAEIRQG